MLFQSDYWFAQCLSQRIETIQMFFSEDEGVKTLIIIDVHSINDTECILDRLDKDGELSCVVELTIGVHKIVFAKDDCPNKTIYVCKDIDDVTLDLMKNVHPILAIFT